MGHEEGDGPATVVRGTEGPPPRLVAHRGASASAPENTLAAFRLAVSEGADAIELDVQPTRDGVPVVLHDATVDRTTDGTGLLRDLPLADVRRLDAGGWFDAGFAGERVPTLDEVLQEFAGRVPLNLELKTLYGPTPGFVTAVHDRLVAHDAADQVVVSSFDPKTVEEAADRGLRAVMILPYVPSREDLDTWRGAAEGLAIWHEALDAEGLEEAARLDLPVWAWTVDAADRAAALLEAGITGIITNAPGRLRAVTVG